MLGLKRRPSSAPPKSDNSRELAALEALAGIPAGNLARAMTDRANWRRYVTLEQGIELGKAGVRIAAISRELGTIASYWRARNQKESTRNGV